MKAILDTDILSTIMRRDVKALEKAEKYLNTYSKFTFSIITRYEILRGLKAKNALKQQETFDAFCSVSEILPITNEIVSKAAEIYAALYQSGGLISDADILIAATAQIEECLLVSNNERHFSRIAGLNIENWLK